MEKSELRFKCVIPNKNAGMRIRLALKNSGLIKDAEDDYAHYQFFAYDRGIVATTNAECFCLLQETLMSYEDAIKLIESIEPDAPEFDIKLRDEVLMYNYKYQTWELCDFARVAESFFYAIGYGFGACLVRYKGNEILHGKSEMPIGWWECKNGKPVWRTK